jgi:hypothetical protein
MRCARGAWLAVGAVAFGCGVGRAPAAPGGALRPCEAAGAAAGAAGCEPAAAADAIACESRAGALAVSMGDRCVPVAVRPHGWEYEELARMDTARVGPPPTACGDRLRFESRTVRYIYSVLEIHAGGERLLSRDPAPASYQAVLSPDCEAAWFWERGGGWLFRKAEGGWARGWFDGRGAVVSAGFSPDGATLFTAGIDPDGGRDGGHAGEAAVLLGAIDVEKVTAGACARVRAPAGTLSEVVVSSAGAFVQLSWFEKVAGRLEARARLYRFAAGGVAVQVAGDGGHASHARLIASEGARPLLFVVSEDAGTWVYDAHSLERVARWPEEGRSGNAFTAGASPSPDGALVALPEPYRRCVTFIRTRDLRRLSRLCAPELDGAGRVEWRGDDVAVDTFPLPYE